MVGCDLIKSGREYDLETLKKEITGLFNNEYGTGNWAVIPTTDLPADFSVDTYTIENGELVRASDELIADRLHIKALAQREAIRAQREARYNSEEISSLYWNWVESGNEADKAKWIQAKNVVRAELPYPEI